MARLELRSTVVVSLAWAELAPYLDGSVFGSRLPYLEAVEDDIAEVAALDGAGVAYIAALPIPSPDYTAWLALKPTCSVYRGGRQAADGALLVRTSPGFHGQRPRYISVMIDAPAAGETRVVADLLNKRLQGASKIQVRDGSEGDWMDLQFVSDGTVPAYGPEGTLLRRFGPIIFLGGTGWTEDGTAGDFANGAEDMPTTGSGIRPEWVFFSTGTATRVRLRVLVYE